MELVQILSVNDYSDQNVVQKFSIPGVANSISWHDDKMVIQYSPNSLVIVNCIQLW
jgi:hypothetical protein